MAPRVVGILGGMGPAATVDLMARLVRAVDAGDDADHVPLLVDNNTQVPSRIAALIEGKGADPAPVLVAMGQKLQVAGAEALAMAEPERGRTIRAMIWMRLQPSSRAASTCSSCQGWENPLRVSTVGAKRLPACSSAGRLPKITCSTCSGRNQHIHSVRRLFRETIKTPAPSSGQLAAGG